jgi:hypothetical protein
VRARPAEAASGAPQAEAETQGREEEAIWPLRCPLDICPLGGRVGARVGVGGARCARVMGWEEMADSG